MSLYVQLQTSLCCLEVVPLLVTLTVTFAHLHTEVFWHGWTVPLVPLVLFGLVPFPVPLVPLVLFGLVPFPVPLVPLVAFGLVVLP